MDLFHALGEEISGIRYWKDASQPLVVEMMPIPLRPVVLAPRLTDSTASRAA